VLSGSGFFVAEDGSVLTNAHVVNGCKSIEVTSVTGTGTGGVLSRDDVDDLALVATTLKPTPATHFEPRSYTLAEMNAMLEKPPAVALWRSDVRQGEEIAIYGFPLVDLLTSTGSITTGIVAALAGPANDSRFLQITAPVQPGNSGGPVFDHYGNVVGVVTSKLDALQVARATNDIPENVGFAIKGSVAQSFLDTAQHAAEAQPRAATAQQAAPPAGFSPENLAVPPAAAEAPAPQQSAPNPALRARERAMTPLPMPEIAAKARAISVRIECDQQ